MNKKLLEVQCNIGVAQRLIRGKWKVAILFFLADRTWRCNELHRAMPDIQQAYLTKQLRDLEKDGLIHREIYKEVPPRVEYSLTDIGQGFVPIIRAMETWGGQYVDKIKAMEEEQASAE